MKRRTQVMISIAAAISLLLPVSTLMAAKPGGGGPPRSPVISTMEDWDAYSLAPYRIHSDFPLNGISQTYYDGVDSVISELNSGYYELSAYSSARRKMFVDFSDSIDGSVPATMLGNGAVAGYIAGRWVSKFSGIDSMRGVGSVLIGGLPFVFNGVDGKHYQVRMNSAAEPGTTDGKITCIHVQGSNQSDPSALCDGWTAVPASSDGRAVGRLFKVETSKGKTVNTDYGQFYFTYSLQFTRP